MRYFEATILTIIILSSFTLAAEDPVHRSSRKNDVLKARVFSSGQFPVFFAEPEVTIFEPEVTILKPEVAGNHLNTE